MKRQRAPAADEDAGSTGDATEEYRRSFVDALMLELAEADRGVRDKITLAFTHLGEDGCAALCAEIRDIEDNGGLWSVETRRRRTKGGVWFALLKSRYAWARSPVAASEGPEARPTGRGRDGSSSGPPPEALRTPQAPALPPEPASTVRSRARGASPEAPEIIILRRRRGAP